MECYRANVALDQPGKKRLIDIAVAPFGERRAGSASRSDGVTFAVLSCPEPRPVPGAVPCRLLLVRAVATQALVALFEQVGDWHRFQLVELPQ